MATLQVTFPDDLFAALRKSPGEVEKEVRLAAAIDWYRRGLISQGRAAELAGLARADFLDELAARKIDVFQVDMGELAKEIELG
jgi:predicted HTH domain antitoxin